MLHNKPSKITVGILICLIIIALKPVPSFNTNIPSSFNVDTSNGETVVQLSENRLAIIDTNLNSGFHGEVIVVEFQEVTGEFSLIGKYNYRDFFENPQLYGY